ncbi:hypothetical protein CAPTEDRAFT_98868 [Capitella teleta]|uniref:RNA helicase n=1 Tax=Capitella teleta TaxID=283909 RepID=R7TPL6_CAPTE|nr:hypothetical protein CAPTEDRAFT_98868 [Capitella teleta]|eukprot:ELT92990.1 hypothetical protein CAPTEDRAFT_98868 [Capitella teleta]
MSRRDHSRQKFWKPTDDGPKTKIEEERLVDVTEADSTSFVPGNQTSLSIEKQRQQLPVFKYRTHILYLLEKYRTVVIIGETGCGKSTQIPQYLYEAGWAANGKVIGVTQPRRVAAITVATRVAEERAAILGHSVGYAIRFDDCTDAERTRIKFVTDGLLLREMMKDPLLTQYSVIMLDEAHERTLYTDIVLGLLKKVQRKREDLRIIVASATLDAEKFRKYFETNTSSDPEEDTAAILTVEGRMFPVDVFYIKAPVPSYLKATVETVMKIHHTERYGDILAFLTGQDEVEQVVSLLIEHARQLPKDALKMFVLPMYGSLPGREQMKVFERVGKGTRKIVIATNIAEASITIPGIVYVIDCGFVKINAYNPKGGFESLVVVPVSQASAQQRAGRAGRIRSGKAYRLYTEDDFLKLKPGSVPEMQRSNMAAVVLQLKALGIDNVLRFSFLSPPPAQNMVRGLELLYALGAVNETCHLTVPLGIRMAEFPLSPMFAKMLMASKDFGCSEEAVTIAAMMQIQNVFQTPSHNKINALKAKRLFSVAEGDHITMLNTFNAFLKWGKSARWCGQNFLNYKGLMRAIEIRKQLCALMKRAKVRLVSCNGDMVAIQKCLVSGFFANAARLNFSGVYRTIRDDYELHIHPTSVLYAEKPKQFVIFNEIVHTTKEFMRDVTVVDQRWLYELAPHYYDFGTENEIAAKRAKIDY